MSSSIMALMSFDLNSFQSSGFSASIASHALRYPSLAWSRPTLSFQATLAKNRATCAASEDGTPPGLRSSVSDISFMISDILRSCSGIVMLPPLCLLDLGQGRPQGGFVVPEPFSQPLLQSGQRFAQRATAVVLED